MFEKLIEDLKDLQSNGILVRNEKFKGSLFFITGEHLGSHGIGGFIESFSNVEYFCPYCQATAQEFQHDPLKVSSKRNANNCNAALSILSVNNSLKSVDGTYFNSVFRSLQTSSTYSMNTYLC